MDVVLTLVRRVSAPMRWTATSVNVSLAGQVLTVTQVCKITHLYDG